MSDQPILVYSTVPTLEAAQKLARGLVTERLAACVNVVPQVQSFYWWEGSLQEDGELLLLVKTRASLYPEVEKYIAANHPYSVPAISYIRLEGMHAPYLSWLLDETRPSEE